MLDFYYRRDQKFLVTIICYELLAVFVGWQLAYFMRFFVVVMFVTTTEKNLFMHYFFSGMAVSVIYFISSFFLNTYRRKKLVYSYFNSVITNLVFSILIWLSMLFFIKNFSYSRIHAFFFIAITMVLLIVGRIIINQLYNKKLFAETPKDCLIIGTSDFAIAFKNKITQKSDLNINIKGFLGDKTEQSTPWLGGLDMLDKVLNQYNFKILFLALDNNFNQYKYVFQVLKNHAVDINIVMDLDARFWINPVLLGIDNMPVIVSHQQAIEGIGIIQKRFLDIIGALFLLIIFLPLWIILAILIKATSSGPVFYLQKRASLDGKVFDIIKFRTMKYDTANKPNLNWTTKSDSRVTAIGKLLRKSSLDETPQVINILKGDMSLVGPRPERPELIEKFRYEIPYYMLRQKINAGVTGWAQVNGWRGNSSLKKRIEHDIFYIKNWSLLLDIKILIMTIWKGFFNKNAY